MLKRLHQIFDIITVPEALSAFLEHTHNIKMPGIFFIVTHIHSSQKYDQNYFTDILFLWLYISCT